MWAAIWEEQHARITALKQRRKGGPLTTTGHGNCTTMESM